MDYIIEKIREYLDVISGIATLVAVGLGYKVIVYDAKKKQAEVKVTYAEEKSIEEQTEKTQMEMVNVLISSSKELIDIYKDIIKKLETNLESQATERLEWEKERKQLLKERLQLKNEIKELAESRAECIKKVNEISQKVAVLETKLKELGE